MDVILAKSAGFCYGVRRAVELAEAAAAQGKKPAMLGSVIHNKHVINALLEQGARLIHHAEEAREGETVVIRAHGEGKATYDTLTEIGSEILDGTCPHVRRIQEIASEAAAEGRQMVIIGDANHPEVQGIKGWGNSETKVISSIEDFDNLAISHEKRLCLVAQTTFNYNKFQELVEKISRTSYDINVLNTICNATQERQVEAKKVASQVDVMLVIGGKNSSNTQKLYEICQNECKNTFYIQTIGDLNPECISSACNVGITAGASTPNNIIEEVHTNVRVKF